jgi:hypothetical protein
MGFFARLGTEGRLALVPVYAGFGTYFTSSPPQPNAAQETPITRETGRTLKTIATSLLEPGRQ